ncbi:MAG: hypothetical protein KAJ16_08750, partial [Calditrichia bacterium]|nr:hypothetical protein [Calditrichia bacterium]
MIRVTPLGGVLRYFASNGKLGKSAMVYRILYFLIFALFITSLYAQSNDLVVNVSRMSEDTADLEATFSWQSSRNIQSGLVFTLSENMQAVPVSIRVDNREMWLKKGLETPANDTIICWDLAPEGLILLFSDGLISNNTSLDVRCHASFTRGRGDTATVEIREVTFRDGQSEINENPLANASIP